MLLQIDVSSLCLFSLSALRVLDTDHILAEVVLAYSSV